MPEDLTCEHCGVGFDDDPDVFKNGLCHKCGRERAEFALEEISRQPCITELLGDDLEHDCGCASCLAKYTLRKKS